MGIGKNLPIGKALAIGEGPEVAGHVAGPRTVRLAGEEVPVDLETEDAGLEAALDPGAVRTALERLVTDEGFRPAVLANPAQVADLGLDPRQASLLFPPAGRPTDRRSRGTTGAFRRGRSGLAVVTAVAIPIAQLAENGSSPQRRLDGLSIGGGGCTVAIPQPR